MKLKERDKTMLLHVISEQTNCSSSRIVYISTTEKLDKCKSIICEKYKLTEEDWEYMKQWGEKYLFWNDVKLIYEKIETNEFVELPY